MNKTWVAIRKFAYVFKRVIPALKAEFHKKDGYVFHTNFGIEDEAFYRKTHDRLGTDYRICNNAVDCHDRPIGSNYRALYIRGEHNYDKFRKLFHEYCEKQRKIRKQEATHGTTT